MKPSSLALLLTLGLPLVACGPTSRDGQTPVGDDTMPGDDDPTNPDGGNQDNCSEDAKKIYTVDSNNTLAQFDAVTKTFTNLGTLNCNPEDDLATPFSMAIDREANAYVLYVDPGFYTGIFKVDTHTAGLPCTKTSYSVQHNLEQFGMGFSTNVAGGDTDTLYIAGGPDNGGLPVTSVTVASLDVSTMTATVKGTASGSPELTGTGDATLWGFFPESSNPRVAKIDKTSAQQSSPFSAPSLAGEPMAWAFAFYGGDFFIFLMKDSDTSTTVYQMDGTNGTIKGHTSTSGRRIVGAGVSTCAPTVIL